MTNDPETLRFLRDLANFTAGDHGKEIDAPPGVTMKSTDLGGPSESPSELIERGWVYRELGWMPQWKWQAKIIAIGDGHYKLLATTTRLGRKFGETDRRGQMMVSPDGKRRLAKVGMH